MSTRRLTRRSLLAASAGAMAGGLLRPRGALAALAGAPAPTLSERRLGQVGPTGATVELTRPADLVGVEWQGAARAAVWLRFRGRGGRWSEWVSAGNSGHVPEGLPPAGRQVGEPVWAGGTTAVQVRSARTLGGVRLHLIDVSAGVGAGTLARIASPLTGAGLPLATPVLAAGPGQPPIIARRAWAEGSSPPRVAPEYGAVKLAFVHHTENPNGYAAGEVPAMLRAIYAFHRYVNGWNDIGYNFVIDLYGRIFEARAGGVDESVVGAHAGGYNVVSSGIAVLGSFMSVAISTPARSALEALLAWKLSLHGAPSAGEVTVRVNPAGAAYSRYPANARVPLPHIAGHRDGDSTDCPGSVLYGELPAIRAGVRRLAPNPAAATLALTAPPGAPPGQATPPATAGGEAPAPSVAGEGPTLGGHLGFLDGSPISGAPILVQARTVSRKGEVVNERTVAEASTNAEGEWSLAAGALANVHAPTWLRALCPGGAGYGACVSAPLHVAAAGAQ